MRVSALVLSTLLAIAAGVAVPSSNLLACGDKFLMPSRGTPFERAPAARPPAAILIYENPASTLSKALANLPVEALLQRAGHHPTTVSSPADFDRAIQQRTWDIIVVDLADGPVVMNRTADNLSSILLPVAFNVSSDELSQAARQYAVVLKAPAKTQSFLRAIDEALDRRANARNKSSNRSRT